MGHFVIGQNSWKIKIDLNTGLSGHKSSTDYVGKIKSKNTGKILENIKLIRLCYRGKHRPSSL